MITPEKMTVIINVKMFFEKLGNTEKNVFEKLEKKEKVIKMKKVIELAAEMSENFETKTRDDGKEFVCLKDGAPDWMKDNVIFPVHGDKGPDDTVYRFVQMAVDTISECDDDMTKDDIQDRLFEIETDIYTSDLTAWLNARTDHIYYLTQALDEFGITDGFQALGVAQKIQIDEITGAVFQALMSIAEN